MYECSTQHVNILQTFIPIYGCPWPPPSYTIRYYFFYWWSQALFQQILVTPLLGFSPRWEWEPLQPLKIMTLCMQGGFASVFAALCIRQAIFTTLKMHSRADSKSPGKTANPLRTSEEKMEAHTRQRWIRWAGEYFFKEQLSCQFKRRKKIWKVYYSTSVIHHHHKIWDHVIEMFFFNFYNHIIRYLMLTALLTMLKKTGLFVGGYCWIFF